MLRQPVEPAQLVIEFGTGRGIAVRQIKAPDNQAIDSRLDVSAVRVVGIVGQTPADFYGLSTASQDSDAVPALLPMPDRAVAGGPDCSFRKFLVWRLELLEADDVRCGLLQPLQQVRQPSVDAVNVVGRDPHRRLV